MIPAVRIPAGAILPSVEVKLKPGWRFDAQRKAFVSSRGEKFAPRGQLPKRSRIVPKTPRLAAAARAAKAELSDAERRLLRYLQVILPAGVSPAEWIAAIRRWPCVEEAALPPAVGLPARPGMAP